LTEFVGLRQDISEACHGKKYIYFHENQLTYPVQLASSKKIRDFQYGYNQVLSALSADKVLFNSKYNFNTFTDNLQSFFKLQPDYRPSIEDLQKKIIKKSCVMYFPLDVGPPPASSLSSRNDILHIVWPHRWEYDKNPEDFFHCLFKLQSEGCDFKLSILGEAFTDVPQIFTEAKIKLSSNLLHYGRVESKDEYLAVLRNADVVVSTSNHEFFGVAVIEAAICGCYPLLPHRLVYPEIFDPTIVGEEYACYRTNQQMFKKLKEFCLKPYLPKVKWKFENARELYHKFSGNLSLKREYLDLFECDF